MFSCVDTALKPNPYFLFYYILKKIKNRAVPEVFSKAQMPAEISGIFELIDEQWNHPISDFFLLTRNTSCPHFLKDAILIIFPAER